MAETPEATPAATTEGTPSEPAAPAERTVPYERFQQVNEQSKEARKQLEELQSRLQEIEDRDKSELERERTQRERLQQELQDRESRLVKVERGGWVRNAATDANFIDPQDALGRVNLSDIESEADAKKAVKKIAEQSKHLIKAEQPAPPQIGQVVRDGQPVPQQPAGAVQPGVSEADEKFLEELKAASSGGWTSAGTGLL